MTSYSIHYILNNKTINKQTCMTSCIEYAKKYANGVGFLFAKALTGSPISDIIISVNDRVTTVS
jgi:hypothetical protein